MVNGKLMETTKQFNLFLLHINELLDDGLVDEANKKYAELIIQIEDNGNSANNQLKADIFASFAYFLFGLHEYDSFFKMLYKAQQYGNSKDETEKVLWEAFIEPNLQEFEKIYETNIEYLISNNYISVETILDFQNLPFWLVSTGTKNEYYIYDKKQKLLREKIVLYEYQNIDFPSASDEFSDYLLIEDSSWGNILSYVNPIKTRHKKTYILLNDIGKFFSCMQGALLNKDIISDVLIFDNLSSLNDYFKNTSEFLPRNIINLVDKSDKVLNSIRNLHNYRLHKWNRKGDEILISICMPSFNRGDRAYENIMNLLQSRYDEEIEFIISNNGTQNDTKKDYEKIRNMDDARIKYFSFGENQGFAINCCKACELAEGKYILLLSDEDLVDFNVLDKLMNMLSQSKDTLAIMRTSSTAQSKPAVKKANAGKDALLTFMLTSNYMSGIILNNKYLKQYKGIEYVKENIGNSICLNYPHMFWELLLCQYGKVQGSDLILIHEGKAEKTEVDTEEIGQENNKFKIPYYATLEGRLEQHKGFSTIFKDLEICQEDSNLHREMYIRLCNKTLFLVILSINVFYKKIDINTLELLNEAYNFCSRREFFNGNRRDYRNDLSIINKYFEQCKTQII